MVILVEVNLRSSQSGDITVHGPFATQGDLNVFTEKEGLVHDPVIHPEGWYVPRDEQDPEVPEVRYETHKL